MNLVLWITEINGPSSDVSYKVSKIKWKDMTVDLTLSLMCWIYVLEGKCGEREGGRDGRREGG